MSHKCLQWRWFPSSSIICKKYGADYIVGVERKGFHDARRCLWDISSINRYSTNLTVLSTVEGVYTESLTCNIFTFTIHSTSNTTQLHNPTTYKLRISFKLIIIRRGKKKHTLPNLISQLGVEFVVINTYQLLLIFNIKKHKNYNKYKKLN